LGHWPRAVWPADGRHSSFRDGPFAAHRDQRDGALLAIYDVAAQGEGPIPQMNSHFDQLSKLYTAATNVSKLPLKNVPDNPHTDAIGAGDPETEEGLITHPLAQKLAVLLNLRYRMLLADIGHIALTPRAVTAEGVGVRQTLTDWAVHEEMFFIHQLSDALNTQPLKATRTADADMRAAAPFELPDTLLSNDHDSWQLYLDVIDRTTAILTEVGPVVAGLATITQVDEERRKFIADRLQ
jgi:hypothetical protein